jgi:hypothetical protein
MQVKQRALAVLLITAALASAVPSLSLELGALQAMPGHSPPYVFRLALTSTSQAIAESPAVTVRQPHDALAVIKNHHLELRLRALTDVELEVSQGGDTVNRLLLKSEFEAARRQLESPPLVHRRQAVPLPEASRPVAEVQPSPPASFTMTVAERPEIERELQEIRGEIHSLVRQVRPWQGVTASSEPVEAETITPGLSLTLWGLGLGAMAVLLTGGLLQYHALARQRRRQHAWAMSKRGCRGQLRDRQPTALTASAVQRHGEWQGSVTVLRRVRVSQKTRRRLRLRAVGRTSKRVPTGMASPLQLVARQPRPIPPASAQALALLEQLRRQLRSR